MKELLLSITELANCLCRVGNYTNLGKVDCQERGKISWQKNGFDFVHFRFDGCVCTDNTCNKCDCIIFRFNDVSKPVMFVIETKSKNPHFLTAKKQIEFGINKMLSFLPEPKNQFRIMPVLCVKKVTPFMKEVCLSNKVTIFGEKKPINLRLYLQDINQCC